MKKPFNIEAAKAGAKVVTRDGRPVRILDYEIKRGIFKIGAAVTINEEEELLCVFTEKGKYYLETPDDNDLFIEVEPTYRPYANAAEMDAAIKKHGTLIKNLLGRRLTITGYDDDNISVGIGQTARYGKMLECYTWLDGTPCGIMEGGTK